MCVCVCCVYRIQWLCDHDDIISSSHQITQQDGFFFFFASSFGFNEQKYLSDKPRHIRIATRVTRICKD